MLTKAELERGIQLTQREMDDALHDPSFRNDVDAVEARYAALNIIETYLTSVAGARKLKAYRDNYHREFIFSVSLNSTDQSPVSSNTQEMAFA